MFAYLNQTFVVSLFAWCNLLCLDSCSINDLWGERDVEWEVVYPTNRNESIHFSVTTVFEWIGALEWLHGRIGCEIDLMLKSTASPKTLDESHLTTREYWNVAWKASQGIKFNLESMCSRSTWHYITTTYGTEYFCALTCFCLERHAGCQHHKASLIPHVIYLSLPSGVL